MESFKKNQIERGNDMKGLKETAKKSKTIRQSNISSWLPIYYNFKTETVYTSEGEGRHFVTKLIRENTPEEIKEAIERWKRL